MILEFIISFLGGEFSKRAIASNYRVTSLSRRGKPSEGAIDGVNYITGDATEYGVVSSIANDEDYDAIVHCIGLLFDANSGLADYNRFVSGSGSIIKEGATYDDITRKTAIYAIEAAEELARARSSNEPTSFIFTSAAEVGWQEDDMQPGGKLLEQFLAPDWLKRYLQAKRAVEARLIEGEEAGFVRPVVFRPSLIYSYDRLGSLPPVGAFIIGNKAGLPFVDRPVTVQSLANAMVATLGKDLSVSGIQRFKDVDRLASL